MPDKWDAVKTILIGLDANPDATLREIANVNPFLALECIASGVKVLYFDQYISNVSYHLGPWYRIRVYEVDCKRRRIQSTIG